MKIKTKKLEFVNFKVYYINIIIVYLHQVLVLFREDLPLFIRFSLPRSGMFGVFLCKIVKPDKYHI